MFFPIIVPLGSLRLNEDDPLPVHFIRETYVRKLARYGLAPLIVPATLPRQTVDALYRQAKGALFTGGGDFDASWYGQKNHALSSGIDPFRDRLELYLLKKILRDKKPFLGICRGCQALAIADGGYLIQNLDSEKLEELHAVSGYVKASKNKNLVCIFKNTATYKLAGKDTLPIICAHHQAVAGNTKHLRVSATTLNGIIEIIEHTDPSRFCFGIQSHPEIEESGSLEIFFSAFAKAVRKQ